MSWQISAMIVLVIAVLLSAFGVVISKQQARQQYKELVRLETMRDELDVEWGRLQLELGTQSTLARIENIARSDLNMSMPSIGDAVMVLP